MNAVEAALRRRPDEIGLSGTLWDGKTLSAYLERQFDSTSRCASASVSSVSSVSNCGNLARCSLTATPDFRQPTKKVQTLNPDPSVDLWGMDEVRFQQDGTRCRMWVPPGVRGPVLLHAWTHQSVGYGGAVRLRDGKMIYWREEAMFNKVSCTQFLHQFYRVSTRGPRRAVVISDNAQYHHARLHKVWRQEVSPQFELSRLPAAGL